MNDGTNWPSGLRVPTRPPLAVQVADAMARVFSEVYAAHVKEGRHDHAALQAAEAATLAFYTTVSRLTP